MDLEKQCIFQCIFLMHNALNELETFHIVRNRGISQLKNIYFLIYKGFYKYILLLFLFR